MTDATPDAGVVGMQLNSGIPEVLPLTSLRAVLLYLSLFKRWLKMLSKVHIY